MTTYAMNLPDPAILDQDSDAVDVTLASWADHYPGGIAENAYAIGDRVAIEIDDAEDVDAGTIGLLLRAAHEERLYAAGATA